MLSFRLITTGLNDIHSVIGYTLEPDESILIQPKDGARYDYSAMHDVNGISIPNLVEVGVSREKALLQMLYVLEHKESVFVYYLPFIKQFTTQVCEELGYEIPDTNWIDVYEVAKNKQLPFELNDLKLSSMYEHFGVNTLEDLYTRLQRFKDKTRSRRL